MVTDPSVGFVLSVFAWGLSTDDPSGSLHQATSSSPGSVSWARLGSLCLGFVRRPVWILIRQLVRGLVLRLVRLLRAPLLRLLPLFYQPFSESYPHHCHQCDVDLRGLLPRERLSPTLGSKRLVKGEFGGKRQVKN